MHASQVLDAQIDLLHRLDSGVVRTMWAHQLYLDHSSVDLTDVQKKSNSAAMIRTLRGDIQDAFAYHVSADMCRLIEYAASQLENTDRFSRSLAPTRSGFVRFEEPLRFFDVRGKTLLISWLAWGPAYVRTFNTHDSDEPEECVAVWMWNDHYTHPDEVADITHRAHAQTQGFDPAAVDRVRREQGRWGFIGNQVMFEGQRMGRRLIATDPKHAAQIFAEGDTPHEFSNILRMIHAFWLLLNQTVTKSEEADLSRGHRKRAGRMGIPGRVTIIHLRRIEGARSEGESLVEWSHRWLVRGHWRNQPVSEHHPLAQEVAPGQHIARIWIAPHVKGPDGKPLVITDKVYALHR